MLALPGRLLLTHIILIKRGHVGGCMALIVFFTWLQVRLYYFGAFAAEAVAFHGRLVRESHFSETQIAQVDVYFLLNMHLG